MHYPRIRGFALAGGTALLAIWLGKDCTFLLCVMYQQHRNRVKELVADARLHDPSIPEYSWYVARIVDSARPKPLQAHSNSRIFGTAKARDFKFCVRIEAWGP